MKLFLFCLLILFSSHAWCLPKTTLLFDRTAAGFMQVQVKNDTSEDLACYVAIDGHKLRFRLSPRSVSDWFHATDKRFNYRHFSHWCDYLEVHPHFQAYKRF